MFDYNLPAIHPSKTPWNKGRFAGQKRPSLSIVFVVAFHPHQTCRVFMESSDRCCIKKRLGRVEKRPIRAFVPESVFRHCDGAGGKAAVTPTSVAFIKEKRTISERVVLFLDGSPFHSARLRRVSRLNQDPLTSPQTISLECQTCFTIM